MDTFICRALFFVILIAIEMLPATAKHEFPRSLNRGKRLASLLTSLLIPFKKSQRQSPYENRPFRKSDKIYVISLEPESPTIKKLEKLALEKIYDNNELEHSYESSETKALETLQYLPYNENNIMKPIFESSETMNLDRLQLEKLNDENVRLEPSFKPIGKKDIDFSPLENSDDEDERLKDETLETISLETWPLHKLYDENGKLKPIFESSEEKELDIMTKMYPKAKATEKKTIKMLPLENLFDENGMIYLTKPNEKRVKKILREIDPVVIEKEPKTIGNVKAVYDFSDLVL